MAFNTNTNTASNNNASNDSWKANGFINFYIPTKDGKQVKLGALSLKDSRKIEASVRAFLEEDEGNISKLMSKVIVKYQAAESKDLDLDLG